MPLDPNGSAIWLVLSYCEQRIDKRFEKPRLAVKSYTIVIERCPETQFYVGYVPGFPGAHSQGETIDELLENIREVISMLLEDGEPVLESEFVGTNTIQVA